MPRDTSHSYVLLIVGSVLLGGILTPSFALADTHHRANPKSSPDATVIEAQPATTATESTVEGSEPGTTRQPDEVEHHSGPVTVTILLNCSHLEVDVEPTSYEYDLALVYRDTTTGQRIPMLAGPFTGSVDDPFGETDLQLIEVRVRVQGLPSTSQVAPDRCTAD